MTGSSEMEPGSPPRSRRFVLSLWIAYLALLPLNLTLWFGIEHILPSDFIAPALLLATGIVLRRELVRALRSDRPVALYLGLFLLTAFAALFHSGLSRGMTVMVAAQVYLVGLYFCLRAALSVEGVLRKFLRAWAAISTLYALVGLAGVGLGWCGIPTPLARFYPSLGPGAWRMLGTLGQSPNFIFSYLYCGFFICLGLLAADSRERADAFSRRALLVISALHGLALFLTFSRGLLGVILGSIILWQSRQTGWTRLSRGIQVAAWTVLTVLFLYSAVIFTYTTDGLFTPTAAAADSLRFDPHSLNRSLYAYKNAPHLDPGTPYTRLPGGFTFLPAQHWYLLKAAGRFFVEHPLFGVGPGLFPGEFAALRDSRSGVLPKHILTLVPHSTYLGPLAEGGLVGFAALVVLGLFLLGPGRWNAGGGDPLARALRAGLIGWLLVGLNIDILNFRWLWLFFAVTVAARELAARNAE